MSDLLTTTASAADHAQRQLPVGLRGDRTRVRAAVARGDHHHLVGIRHLAVRIEHVEQQVVEVGAVRAGEVRADRAAFAIQLVAGAAGALKDAAAVPRGWRRRWRPSSSSPRYFANALSSMALRSTGPHTSTKRGADHAQQLPCGMRRDVGSGTSPAESASVSIRP